jgi:hypothetical protein
LNTKLTRPESRQNPRRPQLGAPQPNARHHAVHSLLLPASAGAHLPPLLHALLGAALRRPQHPRRARRALARAHRPPRLRGHEPAGAAARGRGPGRAGLDRVHVGRAVLDVGVPHVRGGAGGLGVEPLGESGRECIERG